MPNNVERDGVGGQGLSALKYIVLWALIWFAIILATQMPTDLQMAHAYALGSSYGGNATDGRHPMPFLNAFWQAIEFDLIFDICFVFFVAALSLLVHLGFLALGNWLQRRKTNRSRSWLSRTFQFLIRKGVLAGIIEAVLLGGPGAMFVAFSANFTLAGDDYPYAWIDASNINIQVAGTLISYFAACVIAACIAFPTNEGAIQ